MARPKKQLNRKTEILCAAQKLFAEKGFEKTTIDEIAKHIGVGKGTVYLDFKNKEDILRAIVERFVTSLLEQQEQLIKNAEAPYLEILKDMLKKNVSQVFDMSLSQVHTQAAQIQASYQMKLSLKNLLQRVHCNIAFILEKAEKNDEIKPYSDYKNLAHLINISLQGFYPPYDLKYSIDQRVDLNKEEIKEILITDVSIVLNIILSGLKTVNYA